MLLALCLLLPAQADPDALLKKLGSEKAEEREGAERKLIELGESVRPTLKRTADSGDAEIARRAVAILAVLDRYKFLDQLVAKAKEFGMPFPPPEAPLMRIQAGRWSVLPDGTEKPHYTLAFLIRPTTPKEPGLVLRGPEEGYANDHLKGWMEPVQPVKGTEQGLSAETDHLTFPVNSLVLTALQCKARGWNEFAEILLEESCKKSTGHRFTLFVQPGGQAAKTAFAFMAWAWFGNQLIRPDTDRAAIAKHLKALIAEEPKLDTEGGRWILKALDAALVPSKAEPGTLEAEIDDLMNITRARGRHGRGERDPRETKILSRGFDAVPALIAHLDDTRLTRSVTQGFNNFPTYIRRLNDTVSDLLQGLAGDELGKDWLRRQQGYAVEKEAAEAWWKGIQETKERDYFAKKALGGKDWPEPMMIEILGRKYPEELGVVYRTLLEHRGEMQSWPIAEQISKSSLPREKKVELFTLAGRHSNLEHRRAALWQLKEIDAPLFLSLLVETLDHLPATPKEPYWSCREGTFASLVAQTNDPKAWEALEKAARRADVGLRLELLEVANDKKDNLKAKLTFLSSFLDDAAVRDQTLDPKMYSGPGAGREFDRIEVRNYAALQMEHQLERKVWPDKSWSPEQWAALRTRVKEATERLK